jgi:hypothetical protein
VVVEPVVTVPLPDVVPELELPEPEAVVPVPFEVVLELEALLPEPLELLDELEVEELLDELEELLLELEVAVDPEVLPELVPVLEPPVEVTPPAAGLGTATQSSSAFRAAFNRGRSPPKSS